MWEELPLSKQSTPAPEDPYRREAVHLPDVWAKFQPARFAEGAQTNSHRRETSQMQIVRSGLCPEVDASAA